MIPPLPSTDYATVVAQVTKAIRAIGASAQAMVRMQSTLDRLVATRRAIEESERTTVALREARDILIAQSAEEGRFGYVRISVAAGVSKSYASRVARARGVKPRQVIERRDPPA